MCTTENTNQGKTSPNVASKYAQHGPQIAEVQLAALFAKVPLQPKDETLIIDPLPYVGDRALATLQFMRSPAMENRGRLRHFQVKPQGASTAAAYSKAATYAERRLRIRATKELSLIPI